ncbi:MAG: hypothetical protein ABEJ58_03790 [Halodesulfurarchaeum sp.]
MGTPSALSLWVVVYRYGGRENRKGENTGREGTINNNNEDNNDVNDNNNINDNNDKIKLLNERIVIII